MTHDPLCYLSFACLSSADGHHSHAVDGAPGVTVMHCVACNRDCVCYLITKVRADERSRKGTCWREAEGTQIPAGAIRVYREANWFWEMP